MTADAMHDVSIRPIQCKNSDTAGYTVVVTADEYQLIPLQDKHQICVITDKNIVTKLLESLGRTLYAMREHRKHLKAFAEPMLVTQNNDSTTVYAVRMVTSGTNTNEYQLLLSHYDHEQIVPSMFESAKVAMSHAGNVIDIMSNDQINWSNIKMSKNYTSLT